MKKIFLTSFIVIVAIGVSISILTSKPKQEEIKESLAKNEEEVINKKEDGVKNKQEAVSKSKTKSSNNNPRPTSSSTKSKKLNVIADLDKININKLLDSNNVNKDKLLKTVLKTIDQTSSCLLKENCPKITRNHPYDDPMDTDHHKNLNNALSIYEVMLAKGYANTNSISNKKLVSFLKIENYETRFTALGLLMKSDQGQSFLKVTYPMAKEFKGKDAADYIRLVSAKQILAKQGNRNLRNSTILHLVSKSDNNTLSDISQSLIQIDLKKETASNILKDFCKRRISTNTQSGKVLHYNYQKLADLHTIKMPCGL